MTGVDKLIVPVWVACIDNVDTQMVPAGVRIVDRR